ncbi:MAG: NUDIX domain-containing protein [Clostridiales bacterium]|jgi:8-oxo-dGTP diphosphatase|nr:NUDIX domain-containing protein [Clostridiales bacterium]
MKVEFHGIKPEGIDMPIVIIVSRHKGKWILVKHKKRNTYEMPAGHIEPGENPSAAARRELYEETGASEFSLKFMSYYTVTENENKAGGYLFFAEIHKLSELPDYEIEEIGHFDFLPEKLTYPDIQRILFDYVSKHAEYQ